MKHIFNIWPIHTLCRLEHVYFYIYRVILIEIRPNPVQNSQDKTKACLISSFSKLNFLAHYWKILSPNNTILINLQLKASDGLNLDIINNWLLPTNPTETKCYEWCGWRHVNIWTNRKLKIKLHTGRKE